MSRLIDLTGKRFGKLVVIERDPLSIGQKRVRWICKCDCGNIKSILGCNLTKPFNGVKACGCEKLGPRKNREDLVGQKFNRLLVLEEVKNSNNYNNNRYWKCQCDCGKIIVVDVGKLKNGHTKSCGCYNLEKCKLPRENLVGKKFNKLTVLKSVGVINGRYSWLCRCDCGKEVVICTNHLNSGHTKSCGCLFLETISLPEGEAELNSIYGTYKYYAEKRKYVWELTKEEVKNLINQNCYYCGKKPSQKKWLNRQTKKFILYNGIDRIDNKKGYIKENVVTCCKNCNRSKNKMSQREFLEMARDIYLLHKDELENNLILENFK